MQKVILKCKLQTIRFETEGQLPCSGGPSCAGKCVCARHSPTCFFWDKYRFPCLGEQRRCFGFCVIVQLTICAWVYFGAVYTYVSLSVLVPYCFGYCSFVVWFKIRACDTFNFVLTQDCLGYWGLLCFTEDFRIICFGSVKNAIDTLILVGLHQICRFPWVVRSF